VPLEGRISGPSTGFEVTVPGRQGICAKRNSIPLAGAPTSIETSLRGLLFFCSDLFLLVVSRQRRAPCSLAGASTITWSHGQRFCGPGQVERMVRRCPHAMALGPGCVLANRTEFLGEH